MCMYSYERIERDSVLSGLGTAPTKYHRLAYKREKLTSTARMAGKPKALADSMSGDDLLRVPGQPSSHCVLTWQQGRGSATSSLLPWTSAPHSSAPCMARDQKSAIM